MYRISYRLALLGILLCIVPSTRVKTLNNKHLKMAAQSYPPMFIINQDGHGTETYDGVYWNTLKYILEASNTTITVVQSPDGTWGHCIGKNNCTGIVGQVNRHEVDFALGTF